MSFDLVEHFDFDTALTQIDARNAYSETRYRSLGFIGDRLCMVAFALVGSSIRVISLRKANAREVKRYEQETQS
ncbi:uncharacterized DUF497 family protein [Robbsia andropogonis]